MEVEKVIKDYITSEIMHNEKQISALKNDESLLEKGIIDSVGLLHLLTFIEEQFNIQIPDEEVVPENFETLNRIANFIRKKQELLSHKVSSS